MCAVCTWCVFVCTCVCVCMCLCVCMCVCMCVCVCVCVCVQCGKLGGTYWFSFSSTSQVTGSRSLGPIDACRSSREGTPLVPSAPSSLPLTSSCSARKSRPLFLPATWPRSNALPRVPITTPLSCWPSPWPLPSMVTSLSRRLYCPCFLEVWRRYWRTAHV